MLIRPRNRIRMPAKLESPKGGTARVGETLTADAGGLTGASFACQWLSNDAEIAGATGTCSACSHSPPTSSYAW